MKEAQGEAEIVQAKEVKRRKKLAKKQKNEDIQVFISPTTVLCFAEARRMDVLC